MMPYTAYCLVHLDVRTGQPSHVGIYSEAQPTSDLHNEIILQACEVSARSFHEASRSLVQMLRDHPGALRWLYDRLDERSQRMAI